MFGSNKLCRSIELCLIITILDSGRSIKSIVNKNRPILCWVKHLLTQLQRTSKEIFTDLFIWVWPDRCVDIFFQKPSWPGFGGQSYEVAQPRFSNKELPNAIFVDVLDSSNFSPWKRLQHALYKLKPIISQCLPWGTPATIAKAFSLRVMNSLMYPKSQWLVHYYLSSVWIISLVLWTLRPSSSRMKSLAASSEIP